MSRGPVQNFRGLRALVLRRTITTATCCAKRCSAWAWWSPATSPKVRTRPPSRSVADADIFLVDTDTLEASVTPLLVAAARPLVALIGHRDSQPAAASARSRACGRADAAGAPERRLQRAVPRRQRASPPPGAGRKIAGPRAQARARRFVIKAVLALMQRHGVDDEQAFRMLRKESMRQHVTVEELSVRMVAASPGEDPRLVRKA